MAVIKIKVRRKFAFATENAIMTTLNFGDSVEFDFDEEWQPESTTATRTARFIYDDNYIDIPFNGNTCPMPAFGKHGNIYIGVLWNGLSSTLARVIFARSAGEAGALPDDPPQEIYNQIVTLMGDKVNLERLDTAVGQALTAAKESGKFDGKRGESGGYYTPFAKDNGDGTLNISYTPSKEDMPVIPDSKLTLPQESDPTVPIWAKQLKKPSYTYSEVGADASGTALDLIGTHNASESAHSDIRLIVQALLTRINAVLNSDDATLDQLSEIVAYIKSNKGLIDAITTSKVNVGDIIDDLFTLSSVKPLSARQGAILKQLIDDIDVSAATPEKIIFPEGLKTTYNFGKIKTENGEVKEIIPAGGNLAQVFEAFVDEINPVTIQPSASIMLAEAGSYEVGTELTPTYTCSFSKGGYTYDGDTGVEETARTITDTNGNYPTFPAFTVQDDTNYKVTAVISHSAGIIPHTNMGNEYTAGQIKAGEAIATSKAITGYRNSFYGTVANKNNLTSDVVRGLTKSGKALSDGSSFTVDIPVGALRVVIAYPATLQDITSVKDVNGLGAEISSGFIKQTLSVEGANGYTAIEYKIYIMDFAEANDTANQFTVTI